MPATSHLIRKLRPFLDAHPRVKGALRAADQVAGIARHAAAELVPALIRPEPRQLTIAVTAQCNLACQGCRYGRDFMVGERLDLESVRCALDDARAAGVSTVRLYGGEPLLHPDLAAMIEYGTHIGLEMYITTNAILLGRRIDELYAAGLRWATVGFYGIGGAYDGYTQRDGHFAKLEESLGRVHEGYAGRFELQLNFVLIRETCNLDALEAAWGFARRFDMFLHVDLWGYSVPFFTNGDAGEMEFEPGDRPAMEAVAQRLVELKEQHPESFPQSAAFLRSIPDWLSKTDEMQVPCDAYQLIWIGADGSVQLCDTAFPLGNLHEKPLRRILFGEAHADAARAAFRLDCPNCMCKVDSRIKKHGPSRWRYRSSRSPATGQG